MDSAGVPLLYPKHACVVNWTLTPHPGGSAAAGYVGCRELGAILFAAFRCRLLIPSSEFGAAVCDWAGIARVSEDFVGQ